MHYILPVVLFLCLAALIVVSPHLEPLRLRARARQLTEQLRSHGFREGSRASWIEARSTRWPPFHYGKRGEIDDVLLGTLHGLPTRVAGYEVVFNGSRHRYGLALVVLPRPMEWIEVRGERPFRSARVPDHVPDGQVAPGLPEFGTRWSTYAEAADARHVAGSAELAQAMLDAPTQFSWRTRDNELLLWKRDGWTSSAQLLASVGCVVNLLGLGDVAPHMDNTRVDW
jgi:hypothetical protein